MNDNIEIKELLEKIEELNQMIGENNDKINNLKNVIV